MRLLPPALHFRRGGGSSMAPRRLAPGTPFMDLIPMVPEAVTGYRVVNRVQQAEFQFRSSTVSEAVYMSFRRHCSYLHVEDVWEICARPGSDALSYCVSWKHLWVDLPVADEHDPAGFAHGYNAVWRGMLAARMAHVERVNRFMGLQLDDDGCWFELAWDSSDSD